MPYVVVKKLKDENKKIFDIEYITYTDKREHADRFVEDNKLKHAYVIELDEKKMNYLKQKAGYMPEIINYYDLYLTESQVEYFEEDMGQYLEEIKGAVIQLKEFLKCIDDKRSKKSIKLLKDIEKGIIDCEDSCDYMLDRFDIKKVLKKYIKRSDMY